MSQYFLEPYERSGGNNGNKVSLKLATGWDTSTLTSNTYLNSMKTKWIT